MTSPTATRASEHATTLHRLVTPAARIFAATVILFTGTGIAAVFWKMPNGNGIHALYHEGIVDESLVTTPLPSESVALLSPEERGQISLPALDIAPATDSGVEKYAQIYQAPVSLAAFNSEHGQTDSSAKEEESAIVPVVPQTFAPMRQIVEEKPISVEPVNREFQPKPVSVSTVEKSDEMLSMFHFAENSRIERSAEPESPADPFSMAAVSAPALQALKPLPLDGLSPLRPLSEADLQPLSALIVQ
jgi:hypothetical protein